MKCRCAESTKPEHERKWRVMRRNVQRSAFNGYKAEWSPYSELLCLACSSMWKTKTSVAAFKDYDFGRKEV